MPSVLAKLARLVPLAPLHQPHNLAPIEAIAAAAPHIPQVACFDTAFHRSQPHVAQAFALPRELSDAGVRRYGFHGLSYDYIVSRLHETAPEIARSRLIIAHLGNGASLCAVQDGKSVASTMGFTAVDGLMMGTRTGSLDPGVLLYLMQERGLDASGIEDVLYRQSGLLGVSGLSSDMRTLRAVQGARGGRSRRPVRLPHRARGRLDGGRAGRRRCHRVHRPASARTTPRRGLKWPPAAAGSAWNWMTPSTGRRRAASARRDRGSPPGSCPPTRSG